MIYHDSKIYARVWSVKKAEKYIDLRITTSKKDREGKYVNSSWFPRVVGKAYDSLADVREGDSIIITKCWFENVPYQGKDGKLKSNFDFLINEAQIEKRGVATVRTIKENPVSEPMPAGDDETDDCPF